LNNVNGGTGAANEKLVMVADSLSLTTPDLVLLSLLAERPMHGYEVNAELERRQARDWVAISRPQIYYSLEKLTQLKLLGEIKTREPAIGAERRVLATSKKGRAALARALANENWTNQRDRPAFLTWLAISWQAEPSIVKSQLLRRQEFLKSEISREEKTLEAVLNEVGHPYHEAVWMVGLTIEQLQLELRWLQKIDRELTRRAPALKPLTNASKPNLSKKKQQRNRELVS
jgi:DNA-binding PadR family transcriptional regulator